MDGLVSVILPNYNYAIYLNQCISSVLEQTFKNIELIMIDDASTDGSLRIMRKYNYDVRVKIIRNLVNRGVGTCRNMGIEFATGEYLCFIDADDFWYPEKIECQLKLMSINKANLCFTDIYVINGDGKILKNRSSQPGLYNYGELLKSNFIAHSSLLLCKGLLADLRYDEGIVIEKVFKKVLFLLKIRRPIHEDYAFLLKLFRKEEIKAIHISAFLVAYRDHSDSYSKGYVKKIVCTFNIYRNSENFGLLKSIFCTIRNLVLATRKNF
jgi:teichuronic acid biosynthesis glycosyltransferase TuaG